MADPFSKPLNPIELNEEYQRFLTIERDCLQKLRFWHTHEIPPTQSFFRRDMEREANEILEKREEEEKSIELKYSFYDVRKNSV